MAETKKITGFELISYKGRLFVKTTFFDNSSRTDWVGEGAENVLSTQHAREQFMDALYKSNGLVR